MPESRVEIHLGDNLETLKTFPDEGFDLIYIDPPFNTGKRQERATLKTVRDARGDRTGYQGRRYRTTRLETAAYDDAFEQYHEFLRPRLRDRRSNSSPGSQEKSLSDNRDSRTNTHAGNVRLRTKYQAGRRRTCASA